MLYCLVGNAVFFVSDLLQVELSGLVFSFLSESVIYRTDFVMGCGGLSFGLGLILSYKRKDTAFPSTQDTVKIQRAVNRFGFAAALFCCAIMFAWVKFRSAGNAEMVRLGIITAGFWPFIVAFFGWTLPFINVYLGLAAAGYSKVKKSLHTAVWFLAVIAMLLSIVIGFRTYFILTILVLMASYSACRTLRFRYLMLAIGLGVGAFVLVTYIRVESGDPNDAGLLFSVFRRLSLEPIGAANIVYDLVDESGFYYGKTLLMDLVSKLPGRQQTFGGMLGEAAGFEEGLTLTPSGVLEAYANFGLGSFLFLLILGAALGVKLRRDGHVSYAKTANKVVYMLFAIDFVMGGSAALFDFLVRMFLYNLFLRFKL
jgi:hypothetical protein